MKPIRRLPHFVIPGARGNRFPFDDYVADAGISEGINSDLPGVGIGIVPGLKFSVFPDGHRNPVASQSQVRRKPQPLGAGHTSDHFHLDPLKVSAFVHLGKCRPEVLCSTGLPAIGKMQQKKMGFVAGMEDNAHIGVSGQPKLKADTHVLIAQPSVKSVVVSLETIPVRAAEILRYRQ